MIEFKDFSFRYREGEAPVLRDINLSIPQGCFVGITGAAGSGKSTLTYAINGIIPHCYPGDFYGSVTVDGLDTVESSLTDISALVGSVCQDIDSQMVSTGGWRTKKFSTGRRISACRKNRFPAACTRRFRQWASSSF